MGLHLRRPRVSRRVQSSTTPGLNDSTQPAAHIRLRRWGPKPMPGTRALGAFASSDATWATIAAARARGEDTLNDRCRAVRETR